ncbi:MAG: monovalent cation/H(+) antiporter subunit G [Chloroflexota bacterium]|nr:monovalent cation/H(+) antiporter subunit G [Chloroflexota bacterium]
MIHLLVALLLVTGTTFTLIAAIGVLRMPDVYMRLQVSTKGATLGAGTLLLAVPIYFGDVEIFVRALLIIGFVVLTTPISGHMLARAAYIVGVPLWEGSVIDELADRYDPETGELAGTVDERA